MRMRMGAAADPAPHRERPSWIGQSVPAPRREGLSITKFTRGSRDRTRVGVGLQWDWDVPGNIVSRGLGGLAFTCSVVDR